MCLISTCSWLCHLHVILIILIAPAQFTVEHPHPTFTSASTSASTSSSYPPHLSRVSNVSGQTLLQAFLVQVTGHGLSETVFPRTLSLVTLAHLGALMHLLELRSGGVDEIIQPLLEPYKAVIPVRLPRMT